ncbi:MAG TPA: serine/threonine-protein kinase [Ignavibacteriaceae bacterium]|nr:serine/threonine-protein kinase [Ignavibacteriaceae bacterium]
MDQLLGKEIDNYKILEVIGRGGMGVVFKAMDMNLEKIVALKMIDPFLARDENFLKRFKTEARALAKLENQNIVGVYALRETEYGLFMVMEYFRARTISEWLREKGRFTVNETMAIAPQIINAIRHAHKVGVIHRDIKPNNILLDEDGTVKVMDFGLAKVVQEDGSQVTVTHAAAGTLHYMSPEQVKGLKNVDKRSDIYSIGMTLYEMLAGRTPFEKGESEFVIQKQIVEGKIPSPLKYNPLIPKDFVKFIMKTIDKDADKRFQDTGEMMQVLSSIKISDESEEKTRIISAYKEDKTKEEIKPDRKKLYFGGAAALIIIVAVLFLIFRPQKSEPQSPKQPKIIPAKLQIESDPSGAEVFINGISEGKTPVFRDSLNTSRYAILLRMEGYEEWQDAGYNVAAGINKLNIKLTPLSIQKPVIEKAVLILNSVPAAAIYIDNDLVLSNSADIVKKTVAAGNHTIKFVHPQYGSKSFTLNLKKNQDKQLTCYFQQQVNIQSLNNAGDPFWGTIYLNGVNTNKTTPGDLSLGPGSYRISVKKTGYQTVENDIKLDIIPSSDPKSHSLVFHFK